MNFLHPVTLPVEEWKQVCDTQPEPCRNEVYIFLINGNDPFHMGNLTGVQHYLNAIGYPKVYYGEMYHAWSFASEIRKIHKEDPNGKIAIVGYSFGGPVARSVAQSVASDGVPVDLLVYFDPVGLSTLVSPKPGLPIYKTRFISRASQADGQEFVESGTGVPVPDTWHFGIPTHTITLNTLVQDLVELSGQVPCPASPVESFPQLLDHPAPTPAIMVKEDGSTSDVWTSSKPLPR